MRALWRSDWAKGSSSEERRALWEQRKDQYQKAARALVKALETEGARITVDPTAS